MAKKPKLHKKPTIEELDEGMKLPEEKETPPTPKKTKKVVVETDDTDPTPEIPEDHEEPKPKKKATNGKTDYEKRYKDSTREAQILDSKNKKITDAIEKTGQIPEPTEEELTKEYPEWDVMSDFERQIAKDNMFNKRKMDAISDVTSEFKDMDKWNTKVDKFMADPETLSEYPGLEGRENDFKIFVTKPTRRGVEMGDLVASFLYEEGQSVPKKKGSMFESGTGGDSKKQEPASDKISIEEGARLRVSDYKKYLEYVKADKIDDSKI